MRVRIISKAGYTSRYGDRYEVGAIADLPEVLALKLATAGIATLLPAKALETAEVAPAENAAVRTAKPKPRRRVSEHGTD